MAREDDNRRVNIVRTPYPAIEQSCHALLGEGDLPRIELLVKEKVEEWDAVGYEVNGLDIRDFLKGVDDNEGNADLSGA